MTDSVLDWTDDGGPEPPFSDAELAEVEALLAEIGDADRELVQPPSGLWDAINAEVGSKEAQSHHEAPGESDGAQVIDLNSRRRRQQTFLLAAAAAFVVVALAAVSQLRSDSTTVVAAADLAYDASAYDPLGADAAAKAELVETGEGYRLRLEEAALPSEDGSDLELWLIKPDDQGGVADLVAVDIIDDQTEFALPDGYSPREFSVVDISVEPRDGNAAHSGRTILRAPLQF